jgi:hypothetical protein
MNQIGEVYRISQLVIHNVGTVWVTILNSVIYFKNGKCERNE